MAKQKTIHTLESLYAKTTEEGECRLWDGYLGNGVPMVFHDGKLIQVRKLVLILHGADVRAPYIGVSCGNPSCVDHTHIVQRTVTQHHTYMGKRVSKAPTNHMWIAKITQSKREQIGKITQEQAIDIRMSEESGPILSERYGVTRSMVNRIKRGQSWAQEFGNPWSGLGARA